MSIIFNDDLKTGIKVIDEEHEALFEIINKLDKSKTDENVFFEVLIELKRYIAVHFKTEEEYMRFTDYSDYQKHKENHETLSQGFKKFIAEKSKTSSILESKVEFIDFIEKWFTAHYKNHDLKLASFLRENSY